jgi:hypothetical protein
MNPELQNQLAQLADIHPAAQPGWWPPAPGWLLLALILLLVAIVLIKTFRARWAERRRRRAWLDELAALRDRHDPVAQPQDYLGGLNRLFRAVALRAFPKSGCGRLEGVAWVEFITERMAGSESVDALAALARGPYEPAPEFDAEALEQLAGRWVVRYG